MENQIWFNDFDRFWFLTWTSYGQWLPGEQKGFVSNKFEHGIREPKNNVPGMPYDADFSDLKAYSQSLLKTKPVLLSYQKAVLIHEQFEETASFHNWRVIACSIMVNHIHLLVGVLGDPEPKVLLQKFKSYASRKLNQTYPNLDKGRWWTAGGSYRKIDTENSFKRCIEYILTQNAPLTQWHAQLKYDYRK
ncbi:MAG: transposase [Thermoguttaceae bacterium]|nr:transposase [Thermoguttaceae bacterium]